MSADTTNGYLKAMGFLEECERLPAKVAAALLDANFDKITEGEQDG